VKHQDCSQIFAALSEYLDRELPPSSCAELEEHLRDCPECIQFVDSLKRSIGLCRQFGAVNTPDPVAPERVAELRAAFDRMLAKRREQR
jgi:RNA polymerase sigma-70 factor (ECF subfamily)